MRTRRLVKDFGIVFKEGILEIKSLSDNIDSFVLSSCAKGRLIKFSLKTQKVIKTNLRFSEFEVTSITVCKRLKRLVIGDCEGKIKVLCSKTLKLQTNFGALHKKAIYSVALTSDEKYIFSSCVGNLFFKLLIKLNTFLSLQTLFVSILSLKCIFMCVAFYQET